MPRLRASCHQRSITRGRPDESGQANPATCTWEWNNRDGRFSPRNPLSPYFGLLARNTPVRLMRSSAEFAGAVSAAAGSSAAAAATPASATVVRASLRFMT